VALACLGLETEERTPFGRDKLCHLVQSARRAIEVTGVESETTFDVVFLGPVRITRRPDVTVLDTSRLERYAEGRFREAPSA